MPDYKLRIIVEGEDRASNVLGGAANSLQRIGEFAAGSLIASGIERITSGLAAVGSEAFTAYGRFERLEFSLESLVARERMQSGAAATMEEALAGASERTSELIDFVETLALKSPFNQQDISDAFRMSMAYGFASDEAQRLTQILVDYTAGSGQTGAVMDRIALALGQIQARGRLAGQEIMQLTEAGIPVRQILADAFDVTTAELESMISSGLVPAQDAIDAITARLEADFGGAAERQAGTVQGLTNSLQDLREIGLRDLFGPAFQAAAPAVERLVDALSSEETQAAVQALGQSIGTYVGGAVDELNSSIDTFISNWEEGRIKIQLGDLIDFSSDPTATGVTKFSMKNIFDFVGQDGQVKQLSLTDFFDFTVQDGVKTLNFNDFFRWDTSAMWGPDGVTVKIGKWEYTQGPEGEFSISNFKYDDQSLADFFNRQSAELATYWNEQSAGMATYLNEQAASLESRFQQFAAWTWPPLPHFEWPQMPYFDWPAMPTFRWPSLPTWTWPSIPRPSWWGNLNINWPGGGGGGGGNEPVRITPGSSIESPSRAIGDASWRGGLVKVHRDELLNLPRGTRIFNPTEAAQMAGAAAVSIGNVTINTPMDMAEFEARLQRALYRRR